MNGQSRIDNVQAECGKMKPLKVKKVKTERKSKRTQKRREKEVKRLNIENAKMRKLLQIRRDELAQLIEFRKAQEQYLAQLIEQEAELDLIEAMNGVKVISETHGG